MSDRFPYPNSESDTSILILPIWHLSKETVMSNCCRKRYGFFNFLFDCTMTCLTAGFWLIWVFVRETQGR